MRQGKRGAWRQPATTMQHYRAKARCSGCGAKAATRLRGGHSSKGVAMHAWWGTKDQTCYGQHVAMDLLLCRQKRTRWHVCAGCMPQPQSKGLSRHTGGGRPGGPRLGRPRGRGPRSRRRGAPGPRVHAQAVEHVAEVQAHRAHGHLRKGRRHRVGLPESTHAMPVSRTACVWPGHYSEGFQNQ